MCTSVTDSEVERAKNVFKSGLLMQLDGAQCACRLHVRAASPTPPCRLYPCV